MRSGPVSSNRSSEGLPISAPAAGLSSAPLKPRPSLAAFARASLPTLLDSAPRDPKRSPEKASAAATSARERAEHRRPASALGTTAQLLREPAGKPHSSRTVPDTALDRSEYCDPKRRS